jgi:FCD domain-containing protein
MTEDATISLLSDATHIACRRMTPQHLNALHASVDQASCLPARPDWGRKAIAHLELFTILGDVTGDSDLAGLVSSAAGRLHDQAMTVGPAADGIILSSRRRLLRQLTAWDADGAALEMERHLERLHFMERLAGGADPARMTVHDRAKAPAGGRRLAREVLITAEDLADLRAIAEATAQVRQDEALVTDRVAAARARGRSWSGIAAALGVSPQAARRRFADRLD